MLATLKTCFKCGGNLPIESFYAHPAMADGRLGKCKECAKSDARENRANNLDLRRAYDRERGARITSAGQRDYRKRNPAKVRAHAAVSYATRTGKLAAAPCMICGREDSHGHHDNYGRPLDVTWLCPIHHFERHKSIGTYGPF